MGFHEEYSNYIKNMVDGPRVDGASEDGLAEHVPEFKALLEDHYTVACFLPTQTSQLDGRYTASWEVVRAYGQRDDFTAFGPRDFPNRTSMQRLKNGHNNPQSLKTLARLQKVFTAISKADLANARDLADCLSCDDNTTFMFRPNSIKASFFRIDGRALGDARRRVDMSPREFGQELFGTANGQGIFNQISKHSQYNLHAVTTVKRSAMESKLSSILAGKNYNLDDFGAGLFSVDAGPKISVLRRSQGNMI